VLIANERKDRLALVAPIVAALGHEVIAREIDVEDVGAVTARERPDVALVGLGASSDHALGLIEQIVREAACPVIALLHAPDADFVREASRRGVFAYVTDADTEDWQSSIDIVLRRSVKASRRLEQIVTSRGLTALQVLASHVGRGSPPSRIPAFRPRFARRTSRPRARRPSRDAVEIRGGVR